MSSRAGDAGGGAARRLALAALALASGTATAGAPRPQPGAGALLADTWRDYRATYMQPDGRVRDPRERDRSTSEGQSYALVRALVMDDAETFEAVRQWTVRNLQGDDPARLPAWLWGVDDAGVWRVLDPMPASDADEWIAWALLGGARRWDRPELKEQALGLLAQLWEQETAVIGGPSGSQRVLLPGPWAKGGDVVRLNPSYWLPFAWREFAAADPAHDWASLLDPGYALLDACRGDGRLPPDWCYVRVDTGEVIPPPAGAEKDADFGFEAFRVAWTLAADLTWNGEPRARYLLHDFARLADQWRADGRLPAVMGPRGEDRVTYDYQGLYGAMLPAWALVRRSRAESLWQRDIAPSRTGTGWGDATDYYGQNWIWLGYALWQGQMGPGGPA